MDQLVSIHYLSLWTPLGLHSLKQFLRVGPLQMLPWTQHRAAGRGSPKATVHARLRSEHGPRYVLASILQMRYLILLGLLHPRMSSSAVVSFPTSKPGQRPEVSRFHASSGAELIAILVLRRSPIDSLVARRLPQLEGGDSQHLLALHLVHAW